MGLGCGNLAWFLPAEFLYAECVKNRFYLASPLCLGQIAQTIGNVFLRAQMREQRECLKNISDSPLWRGNMNSGRGVEQNIVAGPDSSLVCPPQPRDAIQQLAFSAPQRSK